MRWRRPTPAGRHGRGTSRRPSATFLSTETGSAIALLAAAVVALLWANSPWSDSYESLWTTKLAIQIGDGGISADLRHWVNEGLMTFFLSSDSRPSASSTWASCASVVDWRSRYSRRSAG